MVVVVPGQAQNKRGPALIRRVVQYVILPLGLMLMALQQMLYSVSATSQSLPQSMKKRVCIQLERDKGTEST